MKKLMILALGAVMLSGLLGCGNKAETDNLQRQLDSLRTANIEQAQDLEECMTLIDQVNEGFRLIKESEGQFDIANGDLEMGQRDQMIDNMQFVQDKLKENRELIDALKKKVGSSNSKLQSLMKQVEQLEAAYNEQVSRIELMEQQLAERDLLINDLQASVSNLESENKQRVAEIAAQDKELNKAWFALGTKKELKEFKILDGGEVLQNSNFNREYFTEIDVRYVRDIQLNSKSATLLTTHPKGSYELKKNADGKYELHITDALRFWSVSKYLVVQVK